MSDETEDSETLESYCSICECECGWCEICDMSQCNCDIYKMCKGIDVDE